MQKPQQKRLQNLSRHGLPPELSVHPLAPPATHARLRWCGCCVEELSPLGLTRQVSLREWLKTGDFFQQATLHHKVFFREN
ncbi:Uncharacterised protein [Candidatus Venteria ishoeyi]|uniref:Uncharacterized protein n=1 Tax=Candidatus Venteria ishoeyi TaxID=1899563 RepID=A0A1H6FEI6_9GAMM|nr:Uncharacterised protein [Candidatus Venteria ishoeyi]